MTVAFTIDGGATAYSMITKSSEADSKQKAFWVFLASILSFITIMIAFALVANRLPEAAQKLFATNWYAGIALTVLIFAVLTGCEWISRYVILRLPPSKQDWRDGLVLVAAMGTLQGVAGMLFSDNAEIGNLILAALLAIAFLASRLLKERRRLGYWSL